MGRFVSTRHLVAARAASTLVANATSLLSAGDCLVAIRPKYATIFETPEAIEISDSTVYEHPDFAALAQRGEWLIQKTTRIKSAFDSIRRWIESEELDECVESTGGCVCFTSDKPHVSVVTEKFYQMLYEAIGTYLGAGPWYEMPLRRLRLAGTTGTAARSGQHLERDPGYLKETAPGHISSFRTIGFC